MNLKNILIEDISNKNTFSADLTKLDELEKLTGGEISSFIQKIIIEYLDNGNDFIINGLSEDDDESTIEKEYVSVFLKTIRSEYKSQIEILNDLKNKLDEFKKQE